MKNLPTKESLHNTFIYDNGNLYWKHDIGCKIKGGTLAGNNPKNKNECLRVTIKGVNYSYARIIFCMFHGINNQKITYIDKNNRNTKIENLMIANNALIAVREKIRKNNRTGRKGVYYCKNPRHVNKKWYACSTVDGKTISLKYHNTKEEAFNAYRDFVQKQHHNKALPTGKYEKKMIKDFTNAE